MKSHEGKIEVWDPLVRVFHWALLLFVLGAFLTGDDYMNLHLQLGYGVLGLLLFRLIWGLVRTHYARFSEFIYRPRVVIDYLKALISFKAKRYVGHGPAGGSKVIALIITLFLTAISGLALYGVEELSGPFASLMAGTSHFWVSVLEEFHEFLAVLIGFMILLHVSGVLFSSFAHRENLIKSMMTGYKARTIKDHSFMKGESTMKRSLPVLIIGFSVLLSPALLRAGVVDDLIVQYQEKSGEIPSAKSGEILWGKKLPDPKSSQVRGCTTCHGDDLRKIGKHKRTGKKIEAMSPSVNAKRFTKAKFIEKWFKRNCKWTWGRACTPAEKGNILMFLKNQ